MPHRTMKWSFCFILLMFPCMKVNANSSRCETNAQQEDESPSFLESLDEPSCSEEEKDSFFQSLRSFEEWPRGKKVLALNLTAVGAIAAVGAISWEYGSSSFHFQNEGWFERDTKYGGADKLGHAYSAYVLANLYRTIYKKWGYSDDEAMLGGALSSWSQMTLIEFGDGLSEKHGFSWEDLVMDTVGAGIACLRHRIPGLKDTVDFRLEWIPSSAFRNGDQSDPFTDYSGQKYLLAFKPDGVFHTNNFFVKATEIQFGYYTRGYDSGDSYNPHRSVYLGIGVNVTYLLEQLTGHNAWNLFDYLQVPYTYGSFSSEFH